MRLRQCSRRPNLGALRRRQGLIVAGRGPRHEVRCLGAPKAGASPRGGPAMDKPTISLARNKCYVDGQWVGEPKVPVTNKATGDIIARVPDFGEAEHRQAMQAANTAIHDWANLQVK